MFFYHGLTLLSDGTNKFLNGASLDETLQQENTAGSTSYLHDHLGSTSHLLNSAGASIARYDYKAYGKLEGDIANPMSTNPKTYTGREDDGTGIMYYRARYYDPELEGFISDDPLGDAQRYVKGNPVSFTDPLGLEWRFPDYLSLNVNAGEIVAWSGTASIDRYGHVYVSPIGVSVGKAITPVSGSIMGNWIDTPCKPTAKTLTDFQTTHGFNATIGNLFGVSKSWTPGVGTATGSGLDTGWSKL